MSGQEVVDIVWALVWGSVVLMIAWSWFRG